MKRKAPGLGNVCKMSTQPGACTRNSQNGCLAEVLPGSRPEGCRPGLLPGTIFPSSTVWALVRWSEQTDTNTDIHTCMGRYTHARACTFHAQTPTQKTCTHAGACMHTDRGGRGTERLHKHQGTKKTEKEKERERKGKERETKPMHPHQERSFGIYTQI